MMLWEDALEGDWFISTEASGDVSLGVGVGGFFKNLKGVAVFDAARIKADDFMGIVMVFQEMRKRPSGEFKEPGITVTHQRMHCDNIAIFSFEAALVFRFPALRMTEFAHFKPTDRNATDGKPNDYTESTIFVTLNQAIPRFV